MPEDIPEIDKIDDSVSGEVRREQAKSQMKVNEDVRFLSAGDPDSVAAAYEADIDAFGMQIAELVHNFDCDVPHIPDQETSDVVQQFVADLGKVLCARGYHRIYPDQCGEPEHDYCWACDKQVGDLGLRRADDWSRENYKYVSSR